MTLAAKTLGLQQPTLSAHISRLEQDFGVELFYRRGRRLDLTDFGRTLLEHTRRAFSAEEDAHALLVAAKTRYQGCLTVHAIGPYNLTPVLKAFRRKYPRVRLVVGVGDSRSIAARILDYQGDVGVVLNRVEHADLHNMPFRQQPLVVFASTRHRLAQQPQICMADLQNEEFVIREEGSTTRTVFEQALAARGIQIRVSIEMGSRESVREAVAQGMGLGVVAETAYVADARLVKLRLTDSDMKTHVHFVCRSERRQVPLIADFLETAAQVAQHPETLAF